MENQIIHEKIKKVRMIIIFILVTSFFSVYMCKTISKNIEDMIVDEQRDLLNYFKNSTDSSISYINKVVRDYFRENISKEIVEDSRDNKYLNYKLNKNLSDYMENNEFINSIYIYHDDTEEIYYQSHSVSGMTSEASFFPKEKYKAFVDSKDLTHIIRDIVIEPALYRDRTGEYSTVDVISILKRIPINSLNTSHIVAINIKSSYFDHFLKNDNFLNKSILRVANDNNETILAHLVDYNNIKESSREEVINQQFVNDLFRETSYYELNDTSEENRLSYSLFFMEKRAFKSITAIKIFIYSLELLLCISFVIFINRKDKKAKVIESIEVNNIINQSVSEEEDEKQQEDTEIDVDNAYLIENVSQYIEEHYMEDIGLDTVASQVYLSSSYFGKVFKEHKGLTFTQYLTDVRMNAASDILLTGNKKVSEISTDVGYATVQSFCKAFRKYYGLSPSDYRKKNNNITLNDNNNVNG